MRILHISKNGLQTVAFTHRKEQLNKVASYALQSAGVKFDLVRETHIWGGPGEPKKVVFGRLIFYYQRCTVNKNKLWFALANKIARERNIVSELALGERSNN